MKYKIEKLGNLVELKQGLAINSQSNYLVSEVETSLSLLRIADMPTKRKVIFMSEKTPSRYIANRDDIIYTRTGQVGLVFTGQEGVVHNNCFRVNSLNEKVLLNKYLYWVLKSKYLYTLANTYAAGAAQPDLPHTSFKKIKIPLPDINLQQKIANILSRYDEAIENNNKRIKLLEEMAQNLYKEWFVRFRFPGYENCEFENGIPKGWNQGRFSELFEFKRGKNITADEMIEGEVPVISAGISPSGYHIEANVKGTSLTISSSGANAGYLSIHYEDIWAADCMFITEENTKNIYYLYELLNNIRPVILNQQRGAAQPHVYSKDINNLRLWIPNEELRENANVLFESFHKEIYQLQQANKNLVQQRDLLLPRLMSGKLEV